MLTKKKILQIDFTEDDLQSILEYIVEKLQKNTKKFYIVTPNPELLMIANKDRDYKNILNQAEIALPDGIGVLFAGQILGKPLHGRITGVDFMEFLCERLSKRPITVGFLGGSGDVADMTAECLRQKYPGLSVSFISQEVPENLQDVKCDMLFVAFGSPKQEKWIAQNLEKLPIKAAMGVGGAFDMISKRFLRAPSFMQKLGLEWLFRLIQQPWRIKRQLRLFEFMLLVFSERFNPSLPKA